MASLVYILCAVTSAVCTALLTRSWLKTRSRLLLWSSLCFGLLMVSNVLLVIDLAFLPLTFDLTLVRTIPALLGTSLLLFGLIWELR